MKSNPPGSAWKKLWPSLAMAMFLGYFLFVFEPPVEEVPTEYRGRSLPEFELRDFKDEKRIIDRETMKGRPYLLNFFASWCRHCVVEMPEIREIAEEIGVPALGVLVRSDVDEAKNALSMNGEPYLRVGVDPTNSLAVKLGVKALPETFLVDANGIVLKRWRGRVYKKQIRNDLESALKR